MYRALLLISAFTLAACTSTAENSSSAPTVVIRPKHTNPRLQLPHFTCGDSGSLGIDSGFLATTRAKVCIDDATGIRYLYGWAGADNGGPFFTRLWDQ